jgi:hypothetical protein
VDLRRARLQLAKDLSVLAKAATKFFSYKEYVHPLESAGTAIYEFPRSTEFRGLVEAIKTIADKLNGTNTNEQ